MNILKQLWLYLEINQWNDIWRPIRGEILNCYDTYHFSFTFLFIFQLISPLHEYFFCTSPPSPITFLMVHLNLRAEPPNLFSDAKWSSERMNGSAADRVHGPSLSFIQWRIQWRSPGVWPPLLCLDQNEARRAEKNFWETPPPLFKGLDDGPPLSQSLDPALLFTTQTLTIRRLCCHSSQSWQGRGRGANFPKTPNSWYRLTPVQKNILWAFWDNGHLKHASFSSVPLFLSVGGLFTWVCLCLELDKNDGVKND